MTFTMTKLSNYRVLISGIVSPLAALLLYALVYAMLTAVSADREKDWLFSSLFLDSGDDWAVFRHLGSRNKRPPPARALAIRESRCGHRDSLAWSCLETG